MSYDYKQGKMDVLSTLKSRVEVQKTDSIPGDNAFTYENGIRTWVGAIFVDIVDSTSLFKNGSISENVLSRIMRSFTEQIVTIMNDNENRYEIGIRGDCVYGIFQANKKSMVADMFETAYCINTFMKMFNKLLAREQMPSVTAGIGLGCDEQLVIKAGKKRITHDKIWIGDGIINASNLSKIANRNYYDPICMDSVTYSNIIDILLNENEKYANWIRKASSSKYDGYFYHCDIIQTNFNDWIDKGMKQ